VDAWRLSTELTPAEVQARMIEARRQGRPAWLWPEISVDAWRAALAAIARIAGDALCGRPGTVRAAGDAAAFGLACYTSGMGPLLGWWQAQRLVRATPEIAQLLDLHLHHNVMRNRRLNTIAGALVERLHTAGLPVVLLKVAHTARRYFPAIGTRPMADVDLLVDARDAMAAGIVLADAGLMPGKRGRRETSWAVPGQRPEPMILNFVHEGDPWSIDLHHSLDHLVSAGAPLIRFDQAAPMATATRLPNCLAMGLNQPLLLLHLAAHAGGGLHNLTLLRLTELHLVIRRDAAAQRLSWKAVIDTGRRIGALGYAYPAFRLCEELVPGTVPAPVLDACAAAAPPRVRRIVRGLTPATAQRVDRSSIAEHFMWAAGWTGLVRQIAADLVPARPGRGAWPIYQRRAWQLVRGRLSA